MLFFIILESGYCNNFLGSDCSIVMRHVVVAEMARIDADRAKTAEKAIMAMRTAGIMPVEVEVAKRAMIEGVNLDLPVLGDEMRPGMPIAAGPALVVDRPYRIPSVVNS